jgi:hypothetical protein
VSGTLVSYLATLFAGIWIGVLGYEMYLRRLHNLSAYIRRVQRGQRGKK